MALLRGVIVLAWLSIGALHVLATESDLRTRWRALQANCTISRDHHDDVSVADAAVLFDSRALLDTQRATWLHDLGEWHLHHGGNLTRADEFLRASADKGHATAQFLVGALAATSETPSPDESALFYRFASRGGSIQATMALGYRHLVGSHAPKSCESALRHHKTVADDVMRHKHALPNRALPVQVFSIPTPAILTDDQYNLPHSDEDERARVEFLKQRCALSTNAGLLTRTASLILFSDLYQTDSVVNRAAQRDAIALLERAAALGSGLAMALLGHVHAYGLAMMPIDIPEAIKRYEKAFNSSSSEQDVGNAHAEAANGLGMLYLRGVEGAPSDVERAMNYFKIAAQRGHAEGVFHAAGVMANVDPLKSVRYLEASAEVGHVGAMFELARVREKQHFRRVEERVNGCEELVKMYKQVAEHHQYGRDLLKYAAEAFLRGRYEHSLRLYQIAAELGYNTAEHNAAWLLERYVFSSPSDAVNHVHYTQLLRRGITQRSVDAVVRTGDVEFTKGDYRSAMEHYLRALDWDPYHARALFSTGFMCQWGLGTIHNFRSLERARWYYSQAQEYEPLLGYVLPIFIFTIDMELFITSHITSIKAFVIQLARSVQTLFQSTEGQNTQTGELIIDEQTITSDMPIRFASAMAFDGASSRVTVETRQPTGMSGLTLDMSLWIEKPPKSVNPQEAPAQVLLEWTHSLRVELAPRRDGSAWQIRVLGSAAYESVLTMTQFALRARRWYQIAIVVDAAKAHVTLLVDGEFADSGNLLVSIPSLVRRPRIHIGHSPGPNSDAHAVTNVFHGKLTQCRVWAVALAPHELTKHSPTPERTETPWIDLSFDVRASSQQDAVSGNKELTHVTDQQQQLHASTLTAHHIELRMVRLPVHPQN